MDRTNRVKQTSVLALFDIENHLSPQWKKIDYYVNFIYAGKKEGVVGFEYTFRFEKG